VLLRVCTQKKGGREGEILALSWVVVPIRGREGKVRVVPIQLALTTCSKEPQA